MAALVHDIGKIAVPAEILAKPTRLTEYEFEPIRPAPRPPTRSFCRSSS
jgi:HD-GYP domain-containing protein (c-di-GMP phosphodiesterase class II)